MEQKFVMRGFGHIAWQRRGMTTPVPTYETISLGTELVSSGGLQATQARLDSARSEQSEVRSQEFTEFPTSNLTSVFH